MDSPQSVVSPFTSSPVATETERRKSEFFVPSNRSFLPGSKVQSKEAMVCDSDISIGVLEIHIHEARDIHNICIYQKQDVYAKLYLTSDPENTVSTQIINGGGKNPVFNQTLRLDVQKIDSSLKCEVWMLSRVKNYLGDQLLGFASVPLSDVIIKNGKLESDFALTSTDMFHSPAGFVQLSLSYNGASPDIMVIPTTNGGEQDLEVSESVPNDYDNIEFPDPKIANENQMMVSEYFEMTSTDMDSQVSESLVTSDSENKLSSEISESFSSAAKEITELPKQKSSPSSVSTNRSPSVCSSKSPNEEHVSPLKEKITEIGNGESDSSEIAKPIVTVNLDQGNNVVQQDIVDMYVKSMQEFTDSLAKMKLPLDTDNGSPSSENSSSDQKLEASKNSGSRVFYGSRAFF